MKYSSQLLFVRYCLLLVICGFFFITLLQQASAFSVSPAKYDTQQKSQDVLTKETYEFTLRSETLSVVTLSFDGELAPYATGDGSYEVEGEKKITVALEFSQDTVLAPGPHELLVVFQTQISEGEVGAQAQIVPKIRYFIPYDGPFIEATLDVSNEKTPLVASIYVQNLGNEQTTITPEFTLSSFDYEESYSFDSFVAEPGNVRQNYELSAPKGDYTLLSVLHYQKNHQEITKELNTNVTIGKPTLTFSNLRFEQKTNDEPSIIRLHVSSNWNRALDLSVSAQITKTLVDESEDTQEMRQTLQSSRVILAPDSDVVLFWQNASPGNYSLQLTVGEFEYADVLFIAKPSFFSSRNVFFFLVIIFVILASGLLVWQLLFKNK